MTGDATSRPLRLRHPLAFKLDEKVFARLVSINLIDVSQCPTFDFTRIHDSSNTRRLRLDGHIFFIKGTAQYVAIKLYFNTIPYVLHKFSFMIHSSPLQASGI
jgi:hypothetical protein